MKLDTAAPPFSLRKPRPGDELDLAIEAFDERGRGTARAHEHVFFLRNAVPGERVRARVVRRRRARVDAIVVERREPSADGCAPRCAHFGACGGCTLQNLAYAAQLAGKRRLVEAAFRAQGLLERTTIDPVAGADDPWRYRNKMEFTFATRRWVDPREPPNAPADFALGLHATAMYSKVVDIGSCAIQLAAADAILASARELARAQRLTAWDVHTHTGLLRHLVLRTAGGLEAGAQGAQPEILVNLVTSTDAPAEVEPYARALVERHPEITTLVQNVNTRLASTAIGERERVLHGRGFLFERLGGLVFAISANSFFQTNPAQAERLFAIVREEARLAPDDVVFDLYCGTGSIALLLANQAREVIGFEQVAAAVQDARRNVELNGIRNVNFVVGDVLAEIARGGLARPAVCVVDPPRAGLHPRVVARLIELGSQRIVYVSCNPVAAARDLVPLVAAGYALGRIRPIDLFPHTPHVECVIALERASGPGSA